MAAGDVALMNVGRGGRGVGKLRKGTEVDGRKEAAGLRISVAWVRGDEGRGGGQRRKTIGLRSEREHVGMVGCLVKICNVTDDL